MTYAKLWQTRGNKYKAKKTMYGGKKYDSMREASEAMLLTQLVKDKEIKGFDTHVGLDLYGKNGSKICTYKVDFAVYHNDGSTEYREVKAKITQTSAWRIKWKLLEDNYKEEIQKGLVSLSIVY